MVGSGGGVPEGLQGIRGWSACSRNPQPHHPYSWDSEPHYSHPWGLPTPEPTSLELPSASYGGGAELSACSSEQEKCCCREGEQKEEEEIRFLSTLETKAAVFINFHKY